MNMNLIWPLGDKKKKTILMFLQGTPKKCSIDLEMRLAHFINVSPCLIDDKV